MGARFMAMLVLEQAASFTAESIAAELSKWSPRLVGQIRVDAVPSRPGGSFVLHVGTDKYTVMFVDAPLPPDTLVRAIKGNLLWPDAGAKLARHRAHVIIASLQTPRELEALRTNAMIVTKIAATASAMSATLGIYWTNSETVYEPTQFQADVAKIDTGDWPLDLWVRMHFFKGATGGERTSIGCATVGLAGFIGREIEFEPVFIPPVVVEQRVRGTIRYLLNKGAVLNSGDTLGVNECEQIKIELADRGKRVASPIYRLLFENPALA